MKIEESSISDFVNSKNKNKTLFTPGPSSLLTENLVGLGPCFGRGDEEYKKLEDRVLDKLKEMSGHKYLVRMQGSASLALEIAINNFIFGKILVLETGYYSSRLLNLANQTKVIHGNIRQIKSIPWNKFHEINEKFDWILACYTETSKGLKLPIQYLETNAKRSSSKLMLDATASIGLENGHELAEVVAYSSCKGLFGLTGGAFIASNNHPENEINSFNLNWHSHNERLMTGPYHALQSLDNIFEDYSSFHAAVVINKELFLQRAMAFLTYPSNLQPLLCTKVDAKVIAKNPSAILYSPRGQIDASIVCHLGEVHLKRAAKGEILSQIEIHK